MSLGRASIVGQKQPTFKFEHSNEKHQMFEMKQNIELNKFQSNKFDQPDAKELNCLECVQKHLKHLEHVKETSKNVKLINYRQYDFDTLPQNSQIEEEEVYYCVTVQEGIPMCLGLPIYHCATLQDINGSQYKRPYNCIFVLFVFLIVWGIYAFCFYYSYSGAAYSSSQ